MQISKKKASILNIIFAMVNQVVVVIYGFFIPNMILNTFGAQLHGYTSTVNTVMNYINLLSAGIAPVAVQVLYEPLVKKDRLKLNQVLNAIDRFYAKIGFWYIVAISISATILPLCTSSQIPSYEAFGLMIAIGLTNTLDCFIYSKYRTLLQADQRMFVISWVDTIANIFRFIFQFILIKLRYDLIVVMIVPTILLIFRAMVLSLYCKKYYTSLDKKVEPDYSSLSQRRAVLLQNIAWLVTCSTDVIILTLAGNLVQVSIYSVYNMICTQIYSVIAIFPSSLLASFGQLISEGRYKKVIDTYNIFEGVFMSILAFMYSVTASMILPFISIYTAHQTNIKYVDSILAILFITNELIRYLKIPADTIVSAKGHFEQIKWSSVAEAIINLVISLALLKPLGVYGLLIGSICSNIYRTIYIIAYTNKKILYIPLKQTIMRVFRVALTIVINAYIYKELFNLYVMKNWMQWIMYSAVTSIISGMIVLAVTLIFEYKIINKVIKNKSMSL